MYEIKIDKSETRKSLKINLISNILHPIMLLRAPS